MTNDILPELPIFRASDAFNEDIPDPDYVLPAFQIGDVGILSAAGGTGKSFWMLEAAFQIAACGFCNYDLAGTEVEHQDKFKIGSVLYVSLEDSAENIKSRLKSIRKHWKSPNDSLNTWLDDLGDEFFHVTPLVGLGVVLIDAEGKPTGWLHSITEYAKNMKNCRLIVIDTLRRSHDCDENNNGAMSKVLREYEALAAHSGAAVLLIHHEGKGALNDSEAGAGAGAGAARGASSITDNARWHMRLQRMTIAEAEKRGIEDDKERRSWVRVSNEKANYGEEMEQAWLRRGYMGVLSSDIPPTKPIEKQYAKVSKNEWRNKND